jgi:hypothetical protein
MWCLQTVQTNVIFCVHSRVQTGTNSPLSLNNGIYFKTPCKKQRRLGTMQREAASNKRQRRVRPWPPVLDHPSPGGCPFFIATPLERLRYRMHSPADTHECRHRNKHDSFHQFYSRVPHATSGAFNCWYVSYYVQIMVKKLTRYSRNIFPEISVLFRSKYASRNRKKMLIPNIRSLF